MSKSSRIPRDKENDYSREMASQRAAYVSEMTGAALHTVSSYTIDPAVTRGNIENFAGTVQLP
ncbi:MAG: hydroxymethylglutaryl-CoA reductase, partial [Gammaproteobacteria bacterium]